MTTELFGHEHFYRLTQKLGPRVPENPLGLSVDHDDLASPVDHHHGIGRSLDDQPKPRLGGDFLLCLVLAVRILSMQVVCSLLFHRAAGLVRRRFVPHESEFGFDAVSLRFQIFGRAQTRLQTHGLPARSANSRYHAASCRNLSVPGIATLLSTFRKAATPCVSVLDYTIALCPFSYK